MPPLKAPRLPLVFLALAAACGEPAPAPEPAAPPSSAPAAAPAPAVTGDADVAEEETGRDLTELLVCELLPGDDVAAALGGQLYAEPSPTSSGTMWNECAYLVLPEPDAQAANLVAVRLYSADHYELARTLAEQLGEEIEDVPGLGDDAFLVYEEPVHTLTVLRRDDVAIEVRSDAGAEQARAVAAMVLDKLVEL